MQNVLDGLAGLDPARLSHGPDVEVRHFVDHDEVMATASLLVGHGGHSTTLRALAHDLPAVVIPLHPILD